MVQAHQTVNAVTGSGTTSADPGHLEKQFAQFAKTRDRAIRDELVRAHLPLAEYLAKRFLHRGVAADDLVQVASLGLVKAVDRFEPQRGVTFSTFATPTILGELKRHFRDKGWALRVPRRLQELHLELAASVAILTQQLGRSPTIAEIATTAGISEDEVLEATDVAQAYRVGSLSLPPTEQGDTIDAASGALGETDSNLELVDERIEVTRLLRVLPARERSIVHMRFFEGLTQSEIATRLGISQMQVSRLLTRSIAVLRQEARSGTAVTNTKEQTSTDVRRDEQTEGIAWRE